jgi:hypothetical protein
MTSPTCRSDFSREHPDAVAEAFAAEAAPTKAPRTICGKERGA